MKIHDLLAAYPFYRKCRDLWTMTQARQIQKGLEKYDEPFTPSHWTAEQLLNHALEESVDMTHYLVGLKELIDDKDDEIRNLKEIIASLKVELDIERNTLPVLHNE